MFIEEDIAKSESKTNGSSSADISSQAKGSGNYIDSFPMWMWFPDFVPPLFDVNTERMMMKEMQQALLLSKMEFGEHGNMMLQNNPALFQGSTETFHPFSLSTLGEMIDTHLSSPNSDSVRTTSSSKIKTKSHRRSPSKRKSRRRRKSNKRKKKSMKHQSLQNVENQNQGRTVDNGNRRFRRDADLSKDDIKETSFGSLTSKEKINRRITLPKSNKSIFITSTRKDKERKHRRSSSMKHRKRSSRYRTTRRHRSSSQKRRQGRSKTSKKSKRRTRLLKQLVDQGKKKISRRHLSKITNEKISRHVTLFNKSNKETRGYTVLSKKNKMKIRKPYKLSDRVKEKIRLYINLLRRKHAGIKGSTVQHKKRPRRHSNSLTSDKKKLKWKSKQTQISSDKNSITKRKPSSPLHNNREFKRKLGNTFVVKQKRRKNKLSRKKKQRKTLITRSDPDEKKTSRLLKYPNSEKKEYDQDNSTDIDTTKLKSSRENKKKRRRTKAKDYPRKSRMMHKFISVGGKMERKALQNQVTEPITGRQVSSYKKGKKKTRMSNNLSEKNKDIIRKYIKLFNDRKAKQELKGFLYRKHKQRSRRHTDYKKKSHGLKTHSDKDKLMVPSQSTLSKRDRNDKRNLISDEKKRTKRRKKIKNQTKSFITGSNPDKKIKQSVVRLPDGNKNLQPSDNSSKNEKSESQRSNEKNKRKKRRHRTKSKDSTKNERKISHSGKTNKNTSQKKTSLKTEKKSLSEKDKKITKLVIPLKNKKKKSRKLPGKDETKSDKDITPFKKNTETFHISSDKRKKTSRSQKKTPKDKMKVRTPCKSGKRKRKCTSLIQKVEKKAGTVRDSHTRKTDKNGHQVRESVKRKKMKLNSSFFSRILTSNVAKKKSKHKSNTPDRKNKTKSHTRHMDFDNTIQSNDEVSLHSGNDEIKSRRDKKSGRRRNSSDGLPYHHSIDRTSKIKIEIRRPNSSTEKNESTPIQTDVIFFESKRPSLQDLFTSGEDRDSSDVYAVPFLKSRKKNDSNRSNDLSFRGEMNNHRPAFSSFSQSDGHDNVQFMPSSKFDMGETGKGNQQSPTSEEETSY
ncbi:micronuclear linker histone polyprotein-like [Argopecten irradians]|uniref:micronuclear linker histone polyprotein-like n=1 Tax=Argopecten irradians TaxID=31199 RepID=UPI0037162EF3